MWCSNRIVLLIMPPLILWRVDVVALLLDCILFLALSTESGEKLNRGNEATVLCVCVCVYPHVCCVHVCVCVCMCGRGHIDHSLPCMWSWMKLLHLSESPEVPLVSFLVLAMYASLSSLADSQMVQTIKAYQAHVSMDFYPKLEHHPKVKFMQESLFST